MATTSEKKIAANRENASRSTGPRTEAGKAIASRNSIVHGILSDAGVVPNENENLFFDFADAMRSHLNPANELEALLVDRIVSNTWRMRRLLSAEEYVLWQMGFYQTVAGDERNNPGYAFLKDEGPSVFACLSRYEGTLERGLYRALHELQRLQAARAGQDVPPPAAVDLHVSEGS